MNPEAPMSDCGAPTVHYGPCSNDAGSCPHHDAAPLDLPPPADLPILTPCPCGDGYAELRPSGKRQTTPKRATVTTTHHYRHEGCPYGGTVVVENGAVRRRMGPVFEPVRFGASAKPGGVPGD